MWMHNGVVGGFSQVCVHILGMQGRIGLHGDRSGVGSKMGVVKSMLGFGVCFKADAAVMSTS